jgi:hypothetical protein
MLSLLEATESRITDILIRTNISRESSNNKKHNSSSSHLSNGVASPTTTTTTPPVTKIESPKIIRMPTDASTGNMSIDYGEKPKDKGIMSWKRYGRSVESAYAKSVYN